MKQILNSLIIALISMLSLFVTSCSDNKGGNKTTTTDSAAKPNYPKMSAKERLAKNNILEKHLNWESKKLKGKVKTLSQKTYEISVKGERKLFSTMNDSFDVKGNEIEYGYLDSKTHGFMSFNMQIMYDANNNDTASVSCDSTGKNKWRNSSKYDSRGNEIASISYIYGKPERRQTYKYDDKDNLIELDFYDTTGKIEMKWTYTYDENGFKTGGLFYDSSGKTNGKSTCKYDSNGNNLYYISYNDDGSISSIDSSKYDDKGHRVEDIHYDSSGKITTREMMKYDDHGNRIETIAYKADGSINEDRSAYKEYEYDATGNIIKETEYKLKAGKKVLSEIIESQISYY